jgi:serine/threonine protein phosphatase 1
MLKRLWGHNTRVEPRERPMIANGRVVWAVGDIHGRLDLLNPLLDHMIADLRRGTAGGSLVFLGDYIDRGPASRGVIERLVTLTSEKDLDLHFIRGNHEERMEAFLSDHTAGPAWCEYGGREALASFGLQIPISKHRPEEWSVLSLDLSHVLTPEHRRFFGLLKPSVVIDGYFFTHAGARPGVRLAAQTEYDLMWVRGSFLNDERLFERVVVHGHTPTALIHSDDRRIGIDTGAYQTGRLSAVRLQGEQRTFVETVDHGHDRVEVRPVEVGLAETQTG